MWRDPLDELIADLDRVVTPDAQAQLPSMTDFVNYTSVILHGSAAAKARLPHDPGFQRFLARMQATLGRAADPAAAAGGSSATPGHVPDRLPAERLSSDE